MKRKLVKTHKGRLGRKLANAVFRKELEKELQALRRCDILDAFERIELRSRAATRPYGSTPRRSREPLPYK